VVSLLAELAFVKGHGTANDFILYNNENSSIHILPSQVVALCNRRSGLGADGVIGAVRTKNVDLPGIDHGSATWFMDHQNADGSYAEMCGNGARVFARYLVANGLETEKEFTISTRGGVRAVQLHPDLTVSVEMGPALVAAPLASAPTQRIHLATGEVLDSVGVFFPNPHAVCWVDQTDLSQLILREIPVAEPLDAFPDGMNVEFAAITAPGEISMRVFERGVGETQSCGTGACAVAWAARRSATRHEKQFDWKVSVPGGDLFVSENIETGGFTLRGAAELVARGRVLI
jgi:diaminopimelate epimerase